MLRSFALVTCTIAALAAQVPTGSLRGKVTDASNGGLPGAVVAVIGPGGEKRSVVTNTRGEYLFESLPAGLHQVTVTLIGLRPERAELRVASGANVEWNPALTVPFTPSVPDDTPPAGIDSTLPALAQEIYALIVSGVRKRSGTIAIYQKSLAPPLRDIDDWLADLGPMWDEMRQAITAQTHSYPVTLRPESLPTGTAFRDEKEIAHIHLNAAGTLESLHLSKVLLAPDGQAAVVAYWYSCGNLCGNGTLACLRKRADGRWSVAVQKTLMIS